MSSYLYCVVIVYLSSLVILGFRSKCIPLILYGDGTPGMGVGKAWSKMVDMWSWASVVADWAYATVIFLDFLCPPSSG